MRRGGKICPVKKERRVEQMSVKTRQAPKVRPALSQVRQWPWVWQAAAALGGFAAARAPVFGDLLPLGLLCGGAAKYAP